MTFEDAIRPLAAPEFIEEYLSKTWVHRSGPPDRYRSVLPWDALNAALNQLRLAPGARRLRLVRDGRPVNATEYLSRPDGDYGSVIDTGRLHKCLAEGATLVFDFVDELFPPLRELAESAERALRAQIKVNLYAGWRTQKGFDLHWDTHDTLVLQVQGRKHWRIYEPTRLFPLAEDVGAAAPPRKPPVWDGVLAAGAFLYMPRGWWHVACPLDEPSLHVTAGIRHASGEQLLRWVVTELRSHELIRRDVPHLAGGDERERYLRAVRELVADAWCGDVVSRFMDFFESKLPSRPFVNLPDVARGAAPVTDVSLVRLSAARRLSFTPAAGAACSIAAGDRTWTCPAALVPALRRLTARGECTVSDLCGAIAPEAVTALRMLLLALSVDGAVVVRPPASGGGSAAGPPGGDGPSPGAAREAPAAGGR